jgi:hypothetical protein
LEIAQDVAAGLVESYIEHGDELPLRLREATAPLGEAHIPVTIS